MQPRRHRFPRKGLCPSRCFPFKFPASQGFAFDHINEYAEIAVGFQKIRRTLATVDDGCVIAIAENHANLVIGIVRLGKIPYGEPDAGNPLDL